MERIVIYYVRILYKETFVFYIPDKGVEGKYESAKAKSLIFFLINGPFQEFKFFWAPHI